MVGANPEIAIVIHCHSKDVEAPERREGEKFCRAGF